MPIECYIDIVTSGWSVTRLVMSLCQVTTVILTAAQGGSGTARMKGCDATPPLLERRKGPATTVNISMCASHHQSSVLCSPN